MGQREAGMMPTSGAQGVGKTYQNMYIIRDYVKDKFASKVRGRKVLIFDTNGEYTQEQFKANDIPNFPVKRLRVRDVKAWSRSNIVEVRRIDAKNLGIKEKKEVLEYILKVFRNGMLVLEDINTYLLNVTHMEEVVGKLVNLRHKACDILISYQSLRAIEPRIWQNSRYMRLHYQNDNVEDIKDKVTNPELFKICQLMINDRYYGGDQRFFVYVHVLSNKVEGKFTKEEFIEACTKYLRLKSGKKKIREYKEVNQCSDEEAMRGQTEFFINQYYGNAR